jgi:arsenite methyltransferase
MINEKQIQTKDTFSFKWSKRDTYESNAVKQKCSAWLLERYFGTNNEREYFLSRIQGKDLLDAGCGSGFSAALLFGKSLNALKYTGVDISDSVDTAKERFNELGLKGNFIKEDIALMHLNQTFDIIFSEGVIHHTSDPFKTFQNLISHLRGGGIIMFYVYKKKAPIREFTDDFIREKLKHMDNDQAWNALIPLTKI